MKKVSARDILSVVIGGTIMYGFYKMIGVFVMLTTIRQFLIEFDSSTFSGPKIGSEFELVITLFIFLGFCAFFTVLWYWSLYWVLKGLHAVGSLAIDLTKTPKNEDPKR